MPLTNQQFNAKTIQMNVIMAAFERELHENILMSNKTEGSTKLICQCREYASVWIDVETCDFEYIYWCV